MTMRPLFTRASATGDHVAARPLTGQAYQIHGETSASGAGFGAAAAVSVSFSTTQPRRVAVFATSSGISCPTSVRLHVVVNNVTLYSGWSESGAQDGQVFAAVDLPAGAHQAKLVVEPYSETGSTAFPWNHYGASIQVLAGDPGSPQIAHRTATPMLALEQDMQVDADINYPNGLEWNQANWVPVNLPPHIRIGRFDEPPRGIRNLIIFGLGGYYRFTFHIDWWSPPHTIAIHRLDTASGVNSSEQQPEPASRGRVNYFESEAVFDLHIPSGTTVVPRIIPKPHPDPENSWASASVIGSWYTTAADPGGVPGTYIAIERID